MNRFGLIFSIAIVSVCVCVWTMPFICLYYGCLSIHSFVYGSLGAISLALSLSLSGFRVICTYALSSPIRTYIPSTAATLIALACWFWAGKRVSFTTHHITQQQQQHREEQYTLHFPAGLVCAAWMETQECDWGVRGEWGWVGRYKRVRSSE